MESEYIAVRQLLRLPGEDQITVDTTEGIEVLQFECHYCGRTKVVDPNNVEEAQSVANMLKVQRADGKAFAFCDHDCLRPGAKWFGQHPLTAVNPEGNKFDEAPAPEIIITDQSEVGPVAVADHKQISLERLRQIAYDQVLAEDGGIEAIGGGE